MSKEKRIEEMSCTICNECRAHTPSCGCIMCDAAIESATAIYNASYGKQSKWISVEERLPDEAGYYLVWNKTQKRLEIRFLHRMPQKYPVETYPEIREYFGNVADYKSITHWMPLPEVPKGEE